MVMEPIRIRRASADDIPFLRAMIWEAVLASPSFIAAHHGLAALEESETLRWETWQPEDDPAFLAFDAEGRKLGALTLRPHPSPTGEGWQLGLGVESEVRGRGVGQRLVEHAANYLRGIAAPYLTLYVDRDNMPAIALYRRTGFVECGLEHENVIEMHRSLP